MRRFNRNHAYGAIAATVIMLTVGVAGVIPDDGVITTDDIDDILLDHEERLVALENDGGTTTTTEPPPSTTTSTPPTTTTLPPTTTTTTPPPTTTTTLPPPEPTGDRFDIFLGADTGGGNFNMWVAPYFRTLPYTTVYEAGWLDGDRVGYNCAYMFLQRDGELVGRVTFTRGAAYAFVNDKFMDEGVRYFDGVISTSGRAQLNDCPGPSQAYEPGDGVDYRPLVYFVTDDGELLENRSYTNTTSDAIASGAVRFGEAERITVPFQAQGADTSRPSTTVYERVTVIAYVQIDGEWLPAMIVYYDTLTPDVHLTEAP